MAIANNTQYGLTGGVFSNNRDHLAKVRRDFHVGNLYLNRKITGTFVRRKNVRKHIFSPYRGILLGDGVKANAEGQ